MIPEDPELADLRRKAARISEWIVLALWTAITAFALLCWASRSSGAPAPFPKTVRGEPALSPSTLAGKWVMTWGGHGWAVELSRDGSYACACGSTTWVGSWGVREGCLWITESCRPADADSWRSYQIRLDPRTLSGRIEHGSPGTEVRLRRR